MSFYSAIYGLHIHLNQSIPGLLLSTRLSASPDLRVEFGSMPSWFQQEQVARELCYRHPEHGPGGKPRLVLWKLRDHYHLEYADGTEFLIDDPGTRVWAVWPSDTLTLEDTATYFLGPVMGFVLLLRGFISLHACAVAVGEQAVAIVGPAGAGKSTTAAAFSKRGFSILAEDVVTLDDRGDHFLVRPGYPCIRLWPASVEALYGSESHLPKLTPNWDKCYLDLTEQPEQFRQQSLPLAAIYLLDQRRDDSAAPFVESIEPAEGLVSLVANTYATKFMDKHMRAREFELLGRVLKNVPLRRVTPHTDPARIWELCDSIVDDFESSHKQCIAFTSTGR